MPTARGHEAPAANGCAHPHLRRKTAALVARAQAEDNTRFRGRFAAIFAAQVPGDLKALLYAFLHYEGELGCFPALPELARGSGARTRNGSDCRKLASARVKQLERLVVTIGGVERPLLVVRAACDETGRTTTNRYEVDWEAVQAAGAQAPRRRAAAAPLGGLFAGLALEPEPATAEQRTKVIVRQRPADRRSPPTPVGAVNRSRTTEKNPPTPATAPAARPPQPAGGREFGCSGNPANPQAQAFAAAWQEAFGKPQPRRWSAALLRLAGELHDDAARRGLDPLAVARHAGSKARGSTLRGFAGAARGVDEAIEFLAGEARRLDRQRREQASRAALARLGRPPAPAPRYVVAPEDRALLAAYEALSPAEQRAALLAAHPVLGEAEGLLAFAAPATKAAAAARWLKSRGAS